MARRRALEEAEAELASFRSESPEANKVIAEKKADLDTLKAETEQLVAQEEENREHDKKFLDELTEDLQAYEQLKEEEMKKMEAESKSLSLSLSLSLLTLVIYYVHPLCSLGW
eukprot:TRINITY_DN7638_c0_g2_i3.p2 TRINITY_DN7638_c0_g2~~TRINITY_DN7638_c0_g2_i3.p2  ORF type:complete len:113 (-),score=37.98 TRINITY_DN7638_c0_g2_i3:298-636(-)